MSDREKVIKELERLSEWFFHQYQVAYDGDAPNYYDAYKTVDEAIALLKEQEPMLVLSRRECETLPNHYERKGFCPKCHQVVEWFLNRSYCGFCGKAVKWDG